MPRKTGNRQSPKPAIPVSYKDRDPARIAATAMLASACAAQPEAAKAGKRPGGVLALIVPQEWKGLLSDAWMKLVTDPQGDGDGDGYDDYLRVPLLLLRSAPVDHKSTLNRELDSDFAFEEALWRGRRVLMCASDISFLPSHQLRAADGVMTVAACSIPEIESAAAAICDGLKTPWDLGDLPLPVRPNHLRLCLRPGRTAAECYAALLREVGMPETGEKPLPVAPKSAPAPRWTLDNLAGMPGLVRWGRALAEDIRLHKAGELPWDQVDPGCMLVGPPGCGKTTAAAAIAETCGVPFVATSFSQWCSGKGGGHLSDVQREMRKAFDSARKLDEPCVLFIDELDSIQARDARTHWDEWWRPIVNGLLELLDGTADRGRVVVIGAANSIEGIDSAILRAGRLDEIIRIGLPDIGSLGDILREHLGDDLVDVDLLPVARILIGKTGADCEKAVRRARRSARAARRQMLPEDLALAVADGMPVRNAALRRRLAYHEAGHAVAGHIRSPGSIKLATLSPIQNFMAGVATLFDLGEQRVSDVTSYATVLLAGRAAEQVFLGDVSAASGGGPDGDLGTATCLLARAELGGGGDRLLWLGDLTPKRVADIMHSRPDIADRIESLLHGVYAAAVEVLKENREAVERVAAALLEKEVLDGEEVAALVEGVR